MARDVVVIQVNGAEADSVPNFVVPELMVLGQALRDNENWNTHIEAIEAAQSRDKNPLNAIEARQLQDALVVLRHQGGALLFPGQKPVKADSFEPREAEIYTRRLYALMTKARLRHPINITEDELHHYVANLPHTAKKQAAAGYTVSNMAVKASAYRTPAEKWARYAFVAVVALMIAGGGAALLAAGLMSGGWPIALLVVGCLCSVLLTANEKWSGSGGRVERWMDMVARHLSGQFRQIKTFSPVNAVISSILLGALAVTLFLPAISMVKSAVALAGLAFMALYVFSNTFHNAGSLFNAAYKRLHNMFSWYQFGWSKFKLSAKTDLEKVATHPKSEVVDAHINYMTATAETKLEFEMDAVSLDSMRHDATREFRLLCTFAPRSTAAPLPSHEQDPANTVRLREDDCAQLTLTAS